MPELPKVQQEITDMDPAELKPSVTNFAPLAERQGVFVHSFKCLDCSLEFSTFSWWPDRHTVVNTFCPECGRITGKHHWMAAFSERSEMVFDGSSPEIFDLSPIGGRQARLQPDGTLFTGLPAAEGSSSS